MIAEAESLVVGWILSIDTFRAAKGAVGGDLIKLIEIR